MAIPLELGGRYRNRIGEYTVIELDGPRAVIQYVETGERLEAETGILTRIWINICSEEEPSVKDKKLACSNRKRRQGVSHSLTKGSAFQGLAAGDFKEGVEGTSWRRREALGGFLARLLTDCDSAYYESYSVPRQPMVHIARPDYYGHKTKWREAKFFIKLDGEQATYGLYIERGDTPMDDSWHWPRFLRSLRRSEELRSEVEDAVARCDLHWKWYVWKDGGLVARVFREEGAWSWVDANDGGREILPWEVFLDRLEGADANKWCDLYLCRDMPGEEALALGVQLVDPVTDAFVALLPLYGAAVSPTKTPSKAPSFA